MKKPVLILLALGALAGASPAMGQDTLQGLGRVHGYTGVVFDTRQAPYDILVDASRPEDRAARRYRSLQAAVAAAPAGTRDKPTVIGLLPDVYLVPGTMTASGLVIDKPNITLIGLTDDRRKVVIADDRGNRQGADHNAATMEVAADGFSAVNLTILNYCNVDYDYPGDPARSLKKRSSTITQALALRASGDRHVYSHVALLSRLDTLGARVTRSYYSHAYLEGTDDFLGQVGPQSVWEDSEIQLSNPGGIVFGGGAAFIRTRFRAAEYVHFYKAVVTPNALIQSILPDTPLAWHAWRRAPETLNHHSVLFGNVRESGRSLDARDIIDSAVGAPRSTLGVDLTEAQAKAFNPWNLLRWAPDGTDDGWDPAGVRSSYETFGVLPVRVTLTGGSPHLRTTEAPAKISARVFPAGSTSAIHWTTDSPLVKLSAATGDTVAVTAANTTDKTELVAIRAAADNGLYATAYVTVAPAYQASPALSGEPVVRIEGGKARLDYDLPLAAGRQDQSLVSWFVCPDRGCASPRRVAVSREGRPLKALALTRAMSGLYVMAQVEPAHDLSRPGPARRSVAATPVPPLPVIPGPVSLDLATTPDNAPDNAHDDLWDGEWRVTGAWVAEPPMDGEPRWGWRIDGGASSVIYRGKRTGGDLDMTIAFDSDKLEGQTFSIPTSDLNDPVLTGDIVFKYDPDTKSGYALRLRRTTQSSAATLFQLFRITDGKATPLPVQQLTGVVKPTTTIHIVVKGGHVAITGSNTTDGETLSLSVDIEPNRHTGAGVSWGRGRVGDAIVLRELTVSVGD